MSGSATETAVGSSSGFRQQQTGDSGKDLVALRRVWVGVLLAPASWIVDFLARYMAIRWTHDHGVVWPLRIVTLICLGVLLWGMWLCWRAVGEGRRAANQAAALPSGARPGEEQGHPWWINRVTLAAWGLGLGIFFLLLILAQAYPVFVLDVGEIT